VTALKYGTGDYGYWQQLLSGYKPTLFMNDMQPGFYRRSRKGIDDAVSFFWHGSDLVCIVNGKKDQYPIEVWNSCGNAAVTHEDYLYRIKEGRWPNDAEIVAKSNRAPDASSIEAVLSRLDEFGAEAKRLIVSGPAADQAAADRASDVANSLAEIEKSATALHKVEKEPSLIAGRLVDKKWFPVRDSAAALKQEIKVKVVTPFLVRLRRDAEAEAERARELGVEEFLEQPKIGAGSIKRTVALRVKVSAKIVDYDTAINAIKNNAEVRELVQRLADAACRGGNPLPGTVKIETEQAT